MNRWITLIALLAPLVQVALMGFIGYPMARRRPGGMAAFHRSGFTWWLVTLVLVLVLGALYAPATLLPAASSAHTITVVRVAVTVLAGLALLLAIEGAAQLVGQRRLQSQDTDRYSEALPMWGRGPASEPILLALLAVGEEAVYRGLALGGLLGVWGTSKPVAAAIVAAAFGLAHWYYGAKQIALKSLVGAVLCSVAMSSGWVVAAIVHALLNGILVALNRSSLVTGNPTADPTPGGAET